jgi:hypothetical protein
LSSKTNFIVYVKGKLNHAFTTLIAANDVPAAQNVQRFLGTPAVQGHHDIGPTACLERRNLDRACATDTSPLPHDHSPNRVGWIAKVREVLDSIGDLCPECST